METKPNAMRNYLGYAGLIGFNVCLREHDRLQNLSEYKSDIVVIINLHLSLYINNLILIF